MRFLIVLALCFAAVTAVPKNYNRIVGGDPTTIEKYPSMASLAYTENNIHFYAFCGGTIINNRSILTAAHCTIDIPVLFFRVRIGTTFVTSGGEILPIYANIVHPRYNPFTLDSDIAILRFSATTIYSFTVQAAPIAGQFYNLQDDEPVWATGWGDTQLGGPASEQLQEVEVFTVNQEICRERFEIVQSFITANMLCTGLLDIGGKDQCYGDSGSPVYHHGVLVGICSLGEACALPEFPGVNTRVSSFAPWIMANA